MAVTAPATAWADGFRFPIGDGWGIPRTTQGFGVGGGHLGEDYGYNSGTPVKATYRGTVVYAYFNGNTSAAYNNGWGNTIVIRHNLPNGTTRYSQYSHLSRVDVKVGQTVSTHQTIGAVGNTGFSTGPHLHFEIKSGSSLGRGYAGVNFSTNTRADSGMTYYRPRWFIDNHRSLVTLPAYQTNLTVTQYGKKGTEAVNRFSFTIKNNTSKTVTFQRLKVDIRLTSPGKKGGDRTSFDIPGQDNVTLAPGATLSRTWYRALPRDGTYSTAVGIMVGGSWQGDTQMTTNRKKTITVTYGPRGDLNGDGDAEFTTVKQGWTDDQQRLSFDNFLSDVDNKRWDASKSFEMWTDDKDYDFLKNGKFIRGNFTNDGLTDVAAIFDNEDGTCTMRVYRSDGAKYSEEQWFKTGAWRFGASRPVAADVDADGDDDLVVMYSTSTEPYTVEARVFRSVGDSFSYGGNYLTLSSPTHDFFNRSDFTSADIHGDGKDELIVLSDAGEGTSRITGYSLVPNGAGAQLFTVTIPYEFDRLRLMAGDVDNNSREDIVLAYRGTESGDPDGISLIVLLAKESYATPRFWFDAKGAWHWDAGKFACADFTGNGRSDVAVAYGRDNKTTLRLYPSTGSAFVFTDGWDSTYEPYTSSTYVALGRSIDMKSYQPPENVPPTAVDDHYETGQGEACVVPAPGVLENDKDEDHDQSVLTAHLVDDVSNGTLVFYPDGGFVYVPMPDFTGEDSFTYRAHDGEDYSEPARVTIRVEMTDGPDDPDDPIDPGDDPTDDPADPDDPGETVSFLSVAGADRIATAIEASELAFDESRYVVIATGRNWPDALGGSALAGVLDAPILLTELGFLPESVLGEIKRLGADRAVILGGTTAVRPAVESALKDELGTGIGIVTRIAGADRYETADAVATRVIELLGPDYDGVAFVATGRNFPDALAAAPLAARNGWPLFLQDPDTGLSRGTRTAMRPVSDVVVLGGTTVVPRWVERELDGAHDTVIRIEGKNRYATAAEVAAHGVAHAGLSWDRVGIATGANYPDALAGGVAQGTVGSVMLLTRPTILDEATEDALRRNSSHISTVTFFGSTKVVSPHVRESVIRVLED